MKVEVKLLVGRVGDRFSQAPGDVIRVDEHEARRMFNAGQCTYVNAHDGPSERPDDEQPAEASIEAPSDSDAGEKRTAEKKPKQRRAAKA